MDRLFTRPVKNQEREENMMTRRALLQILTICTLVFMLVISASAGKLQKQLAAESAIEKVIRRGVLRVGMSTFVPWAMKDKTGKFIGFEIDVANRLAADNRRCYPLG